MNQSTKPVRVDDTTRWASVELVGGKVVKAGTAPEADQFRITRLVGDLGYAGGMVVTDGRQSFPLHNVIRLGGQA